MKTDLSVRFAGICLQNPVMNCAGTFEPEKSCVGLYEAEKLGAAVSKTVTLDSIIGNPQPRIMEVPGGLINTIGLQNPGVKNFVREKIFDFVKLGVPLIVSFGGKSIKEYLKVAVILQEEAGDYITGLEANVSCPNVKAGTIFGSNAKLLLKLVKLLRPEVNLPLIVKLTPNVTDIGSVADAVQDAGADAISLINTIKARGFIPPGLDGDQWIEGGLSGPVVKHIALQKVWEVSQIVDLPLIAMGGISNVSDALDFFRIKNVRCVAVGTASFGNPKTMAKIIKGLGGYLEEKGYANWEDFKRKEVI